MDDFFAHPDLEIERAATREVESMLRASRRWDPAASQRRAFDVVLWLCQCYDDESPTLLLGSRDGVLEWCRLPGALAEDDAVSSPEIFGFHTGSMQVLSWLRGTDEHPAAGDDFDAADLAQLARLRDLVLTPQ